MEPLALIIVIVLALAIGFIALFILLRRMAQTQAQQSSQHAIAAAVQAALVERDATAAAVERDREATVQAAVQRAAEVADQKLDARMRQGTEQLDARMRQGTEKLEANMALGHQKYDAGATAIEKQNLDLRRQMVSIEKMVTELQEKSAGQHGAVVNQLQEAAKVTAKLQHTTGSLTEVLGNQKLRGNWGERMAEDVLNHAGLIEGVNYVAQKGTEAGGRPDFTILMPKAMKLHMDVKFPIDNYRAYVEAENAGRSDADGFRKQFLRDARNRVKELAVRRYYEESDSVDSVVLFVPNESVFTFVQQQDPDLLDEAMRSKIILCGPSTLIAVLQVVRQAMDNFMIEKRSDEIMVCLTGFKKEWEKFSDQVDKHGKHLKTALNSFDELSGARTNQLSRQVAKIDALQASPLDLGDAGDEKAVSDDTSVVIDGDTSEVVVADAEVVGEGDGWPPLREVASA